MSTCEHGRPAPAGEGPGGRALGSVRPLRHRSFALLWSGGLVSTIGTWMQTVAVGALLISQTGQATWAVLVAAAGFLPLGLLSPVLDVGSPQPASADHAFPARLALFR